MKITVYTQPDCQPCIATKRTLTRRGVAFDVVDVTEDAVARELLASWGYQTAPVVHVQDLQGLQVASLATVPGVSTSPHAARWSGLNPGALSVVAPRPARA